VNCTGSLPASNYHIKTYYCSVSFIKSLQNGLAQCVARTNVHKQVFSCRKVEFIDSSPVALRNMQSNFYVLHEMLADNHLDLLGKG
jgi:hypothetical protein